MEYKGKAIKCNNIETNLVELVFDAENQSVNKFDEITLNEFKEVLNILKSDKSIKGLLITSAKDVFIVGADITKFLKFFQVNNEELVGWVRGFQKVFSDLENLKFPSVCAINGYALGGGFELGLACSYRISSTLAKIGLPEVKLGLLPGFGGTSRLPRIIGVDNALEWIAGGKEYLPEEALKIGAIDVVVEPKILKKSSINLLKSLVKGELNWQDKKMEKHLPIQLNENESMMAFETARAYILDKTKGKYPAPLTVLGVMQASASLNLEEALEIEAEGFSELAKSSEAKALIGLFLGDQFLKKKTKNSKQISKKINRSAVLGSGIMGGGIAYQSSLKGIPISMKDISQKQLELGMSEATKIMQKRIERGKSNSEEMGKVLTAITPTLSYENISQAELIMEAVVENEEVKKEVLSHIEDVVKDDAIITSNTSTISITKLAENLKRPENFCGMHFFNPVHRMPLVEIIRAKKTSESTIATTVSYASEIGKIPIVVNDCPGFLVNRILFSYFLGFSCLINEGVDFLYIDKVMEKFGWPMGPAFLLDIVGIDTAFHAGSVMEEAYPERMKVDYDSIISKLYKLNWYGKKNNKGFYIHSFDKKGNPRKEINPGVKDLMEDIDLKGSTEINDEEIINRMMLPMLMESSRCLEDKIVETPAEVDMGLVYGLGFPPFCGGIFRWADSVGFDKLLSESQKLEGLGISYQPTEQILKMVKDEKLFHPID